MLPKNTICYREYWRLVERSQAVGQPEGAGGSDPVRRVQGLIDLAIARGASDLHFEPHGDGITVRFRQDGVLRVVQEIGADTKAEVLSRLKVMASLDIAERRRPQDGRIRVTHMGKPVDVRVSTLPTDQGEKIVLRILDQSSVDLDLEKLGFGAERLATFERCFRLPYGMILITGPTGAGKSTTLYSVLKNLRSPEVNITTVEDPIEYRLTGIVQTAVKPEIDLTFAKALRSILRQDPNVIMVGEVRDLDTAQIAIRAALTGHLVLTTLHTNDAPSSTTRLVDMGIEPFLVSSAVNLVVAQRLVRRICPNCAEPDPTAEAVLRLLEETNFEGGWLRGKGCSHCAHTGYKGRLGLFELMPLSEKLRGLIARNADSNEIRKLAVFEGMTSLRRDGVEKARAGITSLEEVLRETAS